MALVVHDEPEAAEELVSRSEASPTVLPSRLPTLPCPRAHQASHLLAPEPELLAEDGLRTLEVSGVLGQAQEE